MRRQFHTLDVFTDTPLAGNPLAVVLDAEGLDDARMQQIAREFNLSETVFVFAPRDPVNTAALRIFTPARELPFAGHPTVGAAALSRICARRELLAAQDLRLVLEERIGEVVCVARHRPGQALAAYFTLPRLPQRSGAAPSAAEIADRLGLEPADIGFGAHRPTVYGAGVDFLFAPIASAAALAKADPDRTRWGADGGPGVYLYTRETTRDERGLSRAHVRLRLGRQGRPGDRVRRLGLRRRRHGIRAAGRRRAFDRHRAGNRDGPPEARSRSAWKWRAAR